MVKKYGPTLAPSAGRAGYCYQYRINPDYPREVQRRRKVRGSATWNYYLHRESRTEALIAFLCLVRGRKPNALWALERR